jgi:HSP20 family protein
MARDIIPWRRRKEETGVSRERESPFGEFHRRMDELFDDFVEGFGQGSVWPTLRGLEQRLAVAPSVDVSETDDEIRITADLPGMDEKDIQVTLDNDLLAIRGEKKLEQEEEKRNYHISERSYGEFSRTIPVPAGIDAGKIKASVKKGVLTITLPKTPELKSRRKTIEVLPE